ncbi:hypothetical protein CVT26_007018 [Gymnopilus dilepis]|uniref:Mid2 domain-containing protein n=1 Tax=Gymnopilus dilepis TaxID=231916 RepID=A0A409W021_9AGAR|nr:hypothetical protein CVT26_007018 [Gymnopilus dilepis]
MPLITILYSLWTIILFFETAAATINIFEFVNPFQPPGLISLVPNSASQTLYSLPPEPSSPVERSSTSRTEIPPTLSSTLDPVQSLTTDVPPLDTPAPVGQSPVTTTQSSELDDNASLFSQSSQLNQPPGTIHFSSTLSQGLGQTASSPGATNSSVEATSLSPQPSSNFEAGNTSVSSHREATIIGISVTTCVLITACVAYLFVKRRSRSSHNQGLVVRPFVLTTPFTANSRKLSNQVCQPSSIRDATKLTWFRTHGSPVAHSPIPTIARSDANLEHLADTKEALAAIDTTALPNLSSSMPTVDDSSENRTAHLEQQIRSLQRLIQLGGIVINGPALGNIENEHSSNLSRDSSDTASYPPPAYARAGNEDHTCHWGSTPCLVRTYS